MRTTSLTLSRLACYEACRQETVCVCVCVCECLSVASQDNEEIEPLGVEHTDSVTAQIPYFSFRDFDEMCVCVLVHV